VRQRPWIAIVLLAASIFSFAGCETQDNAPVATMQTMVESHLPPFPGATLISTGSMPWKQSLEQGTTGAYVLREFGTDADLYAVFAYYNSRLGPLGWSDCASCGTWNKGGWIFRIAEQNPLALTSSEKGHHLVFDEILSQDTSVSTPPASLAP